MDYYIDTEFLEGTQTKRILGIPYGQTKHTIDMISIGIVSEEGREYYAISKDFNIKEAWNKWQYNEDLVSGKNQQGKEYWLRKNVLKPIFEELFFKAGLSRKFSANNSIFNGSGFTCENFKELIEEFGKTNKQIAEEVKEFIYEPYGMPNSKNHIFKESELKVNPIQFYAYFGDYDWVVFCWLFGTMNDLPNGFPYYCIDLKQIMDEKALIYDDDQYSNLDINGKIEYLKTNSKYPKLTNEHNALVDAKWNKELHKFLNTL